MWYAPSCPSNTVCSQPRIQSDSSGEYRNASVSSVFGMDSRALWRLLEADGLSITPGKGCKKLKTAGVNKHLGTEIRLGLLLLQAVSARGGRLRQAE